MILGYQWTPLLDANGDPFPADPTGWQEVTTTLPTMVRGDDEVTQVTIVASSAGGMQRLHLDLKLQGGDWFSKQSPTWPDATIDINVNGPIATPIFTPTPTPQTINYALRFKPSVITYPSATNLDFGGDMTIEFWLRTTASSGGGQWFTSSDWILNKDITYEGRPDWAVVINQGRVTFNNGNPGSWYDQPLYSTNINDGVWHYIAIVRYASSGLTVIYVDGAENVSGVFSAASLSNSLPLSIGSFNGDMDDLRLWNIPRSQAEIQNDMYALSNGNEIGLAGYWPFNEGSGLVANDITQNHISGQLRGVGDPEWILASELFNGTTPTPQPTSIVPTSTDLPPNYTPPPLTATPYPTAIPPTVKPPASCGCPLLCLLSVILGQAMPDTNHMASLYFMPYIQQAAFDIQLFYRVEDEILSQTPEGQHYIDLYYGHGAEISGILTNNPDLRNEAIATLQLWESNLQALVDGQGGNVTITSGQVQSIQTFLDHLYALGSPELRQTIDTERTLNPLEQTIGTTMDQAWAYLNGFQVQPTSWQFEYPTTTQTTFQVSETSGLAGLDNVSFTASDLVQVGQPANLIPASVFTFTPNGFSVPANSNQNVSASVSIPPGTPIGTYTGNITVSSGGQTITIAVQVTVTELSCTPSNSYSSTQSGANAKLASLTASNVTNFQHLPLSFVPNIGQEDGAVRFQAQGLGGRLFFTPGEVVFSLPNPVKVSGNNEEKEKIRYDLHPANVVRIHYQGANDNPEVAGTGELPGVANYLKGNDPSKWLTDLPTYSGIAYRELYAGIELRYEGTDGKLKSAFHVAPGADPSSIIWRYKGAGDMNIDESGNLIISLPEPAGNGAVLIERAPIAWQEVNGNRVMVAVQYTLGKNDKKVSFLLPDGYDSTLPLVIDPELSYSAYLGGGKGEEGDAITLDSDCNVYLTGKTSSSDFPTVNQLQTNQPSSDVFVSKLNPTGDTLLYSTYIGGNGDDHAWGIGLDSAGRITIVGETESSNFPTLNAYDNNYDAGTCDGGPCDDVFVTQLSADGITLRYSTYLGGASDEEAFAMALGADDMVYLTGLTKSSMFPTFNAYDASFGGGTCGGYPCEDVFVTKVNPAGVGAGSLLYSTFIGGNNYDKGRGIAVDSVGLVYVTGYTRSDGLATPNAYQPARAGSSDIFVAKLDTTLSGSASRLYSTYLGGDDSDHAHAIALNGANQVYITGYTESPDFPLQNAFDTLDGSCGSNFCLDAFVTHLDIANNILVYSSYLGGAGEDNAASITLDELGNAYITGYTKSTDFPLANAIQPTKGVDTCGSPPCADAFVTKVNPAGNALIYSTYLGGGGEDYGNAIVVDGLGGTYIIGFTFSSDFYVTSDLSVGSNSYSDAFIVKIDD